MEIITSRPDLEQVVKLYGSFLPDYDYLMRAFGVNHGWIRFSPRLHELTTRLNCLNYPVLYQNEARIQTAFYYGHFLTMTKNEFIKDAHELGQWIDENVPSS